jgi:hypothetical protein
MPTRPEVGWDSSTNYAVIFEVVNTSMTQEKRLRMLSTRWDRSRQCVRQALIMFGAQSSTRSRHRRTHKSRIAIFAEMLTKYFLAPISRIQSVFILLHSLHCSPYCSYAPSPLSPLSLHPPSKWNLYSSSHLKTEHLYLIQPPHK